MSQLPLEWTKHLKTPEQKEDFEKTVRNSFFVLSRLKEITEEKIKTIYSSETRESTYTDPSWAYKQAHLNGKIEGLTKILELLSFLDKR